MRKRIGPRHNLVRLLLGDAHLRRTVSKGHRLRRKRALTGERERTPDILDVHRLRREQGHVTADLLEVQRRHGNPRRELGIKHLDVGLIAVQEVELVANAALLLAVLQRDGEVVGLRLGDTERDRVVVRHSLHNAIEVVGVETDIKLGRRVVVLVVLKLVCKEAHVRKDGASVVHRHHADTLSIKDQTHLHKHGLETLGKGADGRRLNRLGHNNVVAHFVYPSAGVVSSLPRAVDGVEDPCNRPKEGQTDENESNHVAGKETHVAQETGGVLRSEEGEAGGHEDEDDHKDDEGCTRNPDGHLPDLLRRNPHTEYSGHLGRLLCGLVTCSVSRHCVYGRSTFRPLRP